MKVLIHPFWEILSEITHSLPGRSTQSTGVG